MRIFSDFSESSRPSAVALGLFDGMHIAHTAVIRAVTDDPALVPTVLTFHADALPNKPLHQSILSEEQRLSRIAECGIAQAYLPDFSAIASMEPERFFKEILLARLHARVLSCGYDYTFGKNASGDAKLLAALCEDAKITLHLLPRVEVGGIPVSSRVLRERLLAGDIPGVNAMLSSPYRVESEVMHGWGKAQDLGFPTVNQYFAPEQVIPKFGVYHTRTFLDGTWVRSITNIGVKPTFDRETAPVAETHLLGVSGDFYGKTLPVEFLRMARPEQRFPTVDALRMQMEADVRLRAEANE